MRAFPAQMLIPRKPGWKCEPGWKLAPRRLRKQCTTLPTFRRNGPMHKPRTFGRNRRDDRRRKQLGVKRYRRRAVAVSPAEVQPQARGVHLPGWLDSRVARPLRLPRGPNLRRGHQRLPLPEWIQSDRRQVREMPRSPDRDQWQVRATMPRWQRACGFWALCVPRSRDIGGWKVRRQASSAGDTAIRGIVSEDHPQSQTPLTHGSKQTYSRAAARYGFGAASSCQTRSG